MNSRELIKAAIAHQETEFIPSMIGMTGEVLAMLKEKHDDVEAFLGNDVAFVYSPWWDWCDLPADWKGELPPTSPPNVRGFGSYESFNTEAETAHKSGKYVLVPIWGSHFEKAVSARGFENFLADLGGEEDFCKFLLNDIIRRNLVMLDNLLQNHNIDGVLLGSDWGSQQGLLMAEQTWDRLIRPGEQQEYDLIHRYGKDVWVHSCGNILPLIPKLIEMGVDVLNPLQPECIDNAFVKEKYGDKITFWCGVSTQQTLPNGTPEEVYAEAIRVKNIMGKGGGFIFAPSQFLQDDVPLANVEMLVKAANEPRTT